MVLLTLLLCLIDGWIVLNVKYSNILYGCVLFGSYCILFILRCQIITIYKLISQEERVEGCNKVHLCHSKRTRFQVDVIIANDRYSDIICLFAQSHTNYSMNSLLLKLKYFQFNFTIMLEDKPQEDILQRICWNVKHIFCFAYKFKLGLV